MIAWHNYQKIILFTLSGGLVLWWVFINFFDVGGVVQGQLWTGTHGLVALLGGVIGLMNARAWGGMKSFAGRAMIMFSVGLFCQEFGQLVFAYYIKFKGIEVPYPSLADFGYFLTLPFYLYGAYLLCGWSRSLGLIRWCERGVLLVGLALTTLLVFTIPMFLHGYNHHVLSLVGVWWSYLYLLVNSLFVFLAAVPFLSLRLTPQWVLYRPVLFFALALFFQYLADYLFFVQINFEIWAPGGFNDMTYFIAYYFMAFSLIRFRVLMEDTQVVRGLDEVQPYFSQWYLQWVKTHLRNFKRQAV